MESLPSFLGKRIIESGGLNLRNKGPSFLWNLFITFKGEAYVWWHNLDGRNKLTKEEFVPFFLIRW
jgi:hypothetical protein